MSCSDDCESTRCSARYMSALLHNSAPLKWPQPPTKRAEMNTDVLQVVHEKDPWIEETAYVARRHDSSWPNIEEEVVQIVDKKARRKSWHAIKFERKRRKGVIEGSPPEARQKRPSWWNIFAPQQWPRYYSRWFCAGIVCHFILLLGYNLTTTYLYFYVV